MQLSIRVAVLDAIDGDPAIALQDPFLSNRHSGRPRHQAVADRSGADGPERVSFRKITFMRDEGPGADLDGNLETLAADEHRGLRSCERTGAPPHQRQAAVGRVVTGIGDAASPGIRLANGRNVEHNRLARMRVKFQPHMPPSRQSVDGKRDVATAGLAADAVSLGRQIVVVDVVDLALVVAGQDRTDRRRAVGAITDHGFHRLIVGMAAEERHDVQLFAPKPQQEGLQQVRRQNDACLPGAQILDHHIPPFAAHDRD